MVILVVAGFWKGCHLERHITLKHFQYLAYLLLALDLLYLYFTFAEMLPEGYVMDEETGPLLAAMLVGQYAPYFWLFVWPAAPAAHPGGLSANTDRPGNHHSGGAGRVGDVAKTSAHRGAACTHPLIGSDWAYFS